MPKIRLDLETLSVETFDTVERDGSAEGTVFGQVDTIQRYCSDGQTCQESVCGGCTGATDCGTCETYCGTCATNCGTCDPYCCCTCSCY